MIGLTQIDLESLSYGETELLKAMRIHRDVLRSLLWVGLFKFFQKWGWGDDREVLGRV